METTPSDGLNPVIAHQVKNFWAKELGLAAEDFARPGTTVLTQNTNFHPDEVSHYAIEQRTILRVNPALETKTGELLSRHGDTVSVTVEHIRGFFGPDKTVVAGGKNYHFLDSNNFTPVITPAGYTIRQLPPVHDEPMLAFFRACDPAEVAEVELFMDSPSPVIFGCFTETGRLAGYADFVYQGEVIADIGVLTHPEHRGRGLAKAMASAISAWCLEQGLVAMYRYRIENTLSGKVARALGYNDPYITVRSLKVV